jgi:hypothetical protein
LLWETRKDRTDAASSGSLARLPAAAAAVSDGQVFPTKALRKFLGSLTARESPVLMDLGPVVGANVTFFGERLGCKILIEDLFADLARHQRSGGTPFAESLGHRLRHDAGSVDGVLCWNLFDYLDPAAAQVLAASLTRLLRRDGVVLAFFTTVAIPDGSFFKYLVMNEETLKQRPYADGGKSRKALQNRDIIRMFEGLKVSESFLLKTNVREFLFRKEDEPGKSKG